MYGVGCSSDEIECPAANPHIHTGHCISRDWLCDGNTDCNDEADERVDVCRLFSPGMKNSVLKTLLLIIRMIPFKLCMGSMFTNMFYV